MRKEYRRLRKIRNIEKYTAYGAPDITPINEIVENKEDNTDLFICAYKDFIPPVNNKAYKIITQEGKAITNTNGLPVIYENSNNSLIQLNRSLGESSSVYWLWKNYPLKKYVGICHYRSYFDFKNDGSINFIPNLDTLFRQYDAVCGLEQNGLIDKISIYKFFDDCHDINDLVTALALVPRFFPDYTFEECFSILDKPFIGNRNMVLLKRDDFCRWCEFWSTILTEWHKQRSINNDADVLNYVTNKKEIYDNKQRPDLTFQARLSGFIVERLMTLFFKHNFKKILQVPIRITANREYRPNEFALDTDKAKDLIIYCCYHKKGQVSEFNLKESEHFKLVYGPNDPLNPYFAELSMYDYVLNTDSLPDFIGLCHYRRQIKPNDIDIDKLKDGYVYVFNDIIQKEYNGIYQWSRKEWFGLEWLYEDYKEYITEKYGEKSAFYYLMDKSTHCYANCSCVIDRDRFISLCDYIFGFIDFVDKKYSLNKDSKKYSKFWTMKKYKFAKTSKIQEYATESHKRGLAMIGEWMVSNFIEGYIPKEKIIPLGQANQIVD